MSKSIKVILISVSVIALGYVVYITQKPNVPKEEIKIDGQNETNDSANIQPEKNKSESNNNLTPIVENDGKGIDISDWKTYLNDEFGFELKYPKDYLFEDQTKTVAGDDPASHPWYTRTDFLLSYLMWGEVNLEILNTTDQDKIMSTGGWEFIKANGIKKIGDLTIYLYSIDSNVNNMQVILHNGKAYKFIHYVPEENFEKIISTLKFLK